MKVRFWGTRGSVPVSGEQYQAVGGNTPCIEVEYDGYRLILDGGTGLRALGGAVGWQPIDACVLFSHFHWDHIQGVPFFAPAFHPESRLTFAGVPGELGVRESLARQMEPPTFPIGPELLVGVKAYLDVKVGAPFEVGPFRITATPQPHPNGVAAYRIEAGGRSLVYATDIEHGGQEDAPLLDASAGADLLIHDAQYHWSEYVGQAGPPRRGWGHSTWLEAVATAQRAGAQRLALFHHDPARDDAAVAEIEDLARQRFAAAFAARQDQELVL